MIIGKTHIDKPLSNFALNYKITGFIADQLAPLVMVPNQTDIYKIWSQADLWRSEDTLRAPGTEPNRVRLRVTSASFAVQNYELAHEVTDEEVTNADAMDRAMIEQGGVQMLLDKLGIDWDVRLAGKIFVAAGVGSSTAVASNWGGGTGADPIGDVETAMDNVEDATGYRPTDATFGGLAWRLFSRNPDVRDRVSPAGFSTGGANATKESVRDFLGLQKLRVGGVYRNIAQETEDLNLARVWGDNVLLSYHTPTPSTQIPTYMATFRWRRAPGGNMTVRRMPHDDLIKSQTLAVGYYQDERVVSAPLAFLILRVSSDN